MTVLQRKELEESPLADLHAIASELGLEGFRAMRREVLVAAILESQGGEEAAGGEEAEEPVEEESAPEPPAQEPEPEPPADEAPAGEEEPEAAEEPLSDEEVASGVLDILPNGSGFVRTDPSSQSRDDVYVSAAQIRRCELRAGDEVAGPARPPRRNERHPSLVRIDTVNGRPAEPPEERPLFSDLTPVFPTERLEAPASLQGVPFGRGSRVVISGPPGAGATVLLREIVATLAERHPEIELAVALAGVRPEEVTEWRRDAAAPVTGGAFDRSPETQVQAAELAIERAKRAVERGGHAAVAVDSLEALPAGAQRRLLGAARNTEESGALTVIATIGMVWEPQRLATTRIVLDLPGAGDRGPRVSAERSSTLRADLLA